MANITLSVDDKVLKAARKIAAQRGTSVNALVRKHLAEIVTMDSRLRSIVDRLEVIAKDAGAEVGPVTWSRGDLHDR